jgi:hypothetical protein
MSHFVHHIISTFMRISPVSLCGRIIRGSLARGAVVTLLRHKDVWRRGGITFAFWAIRSKPGRSALRLSRSICSTHCIRSVMGTGPIFRRGPEGWMDTYKNRRKNVWQDRRNGICTRHRLLLSVLVIIKQNMRLGGNNEWGKWETNTQVCVRKPEEKRWCRIKNGSQE